MNIIFLLFSQLVPKGTFFIALWFLLTFPSVFCSHDIIESALKHIRFVVSKSRCRKLFSELTSADLSVPFDEFPFFSWAFPMPFSVRFFPNMLATPFPFLPLDLFCFFFFPDFILISPFSSGHVWMWELDCEESWVPKNWCFWTAVLEKTLESPLDCKEIQPVHPKGDQSWVSTGRTDVEAESPILWPPDLKSWFIGKDPDAGKDWGQEEKGMPEDEIDGWMVSSTHWTWVWVDYGSWDGQGGLACCGSWGRKESDRTERLNWTEQYKFLNNILNTIIWKMNLVGFFWKSFSLLTWYREISPSRGTDCFSEELTLLEIKPLFFKCVLRESYVKILIAI